MELKKFTNRQLVELMAKEHGCSGAWKEFIERYHKFVCYLVFSESRRIGFKEGMAHTEDLAHHVYIKLLDNESAALKKFRNVHENSIFQFLKIIAIREVQNRARSSRAQKRGRDDENLSIEAIAEILEINFKNRHTSIGMFELEDAINYCLQKTIKEGESKERDMLILRLRIFGQFMPDEIQPLLQSDLEAKTVANIIAKNIKELRNCLRDNGLGTA